MNNIRLKGCSGGEMEEAFDYIKKNGGLDTEESYPYEGRDGECRFKSSNIGAKDVGYKMIPSGDENALKAVIANQVEIHLDFLDLRL